MKHMHTVLLGPPGSSDAGFHQCMAHKLLQENDASSRTPLERLPTCSEQAESGRSAKCVAACRLRAGRPLRAELWLMWQMAGCRHTHSNWGQSTAAGGQAHPLAERPPRGTLSTEPSSTLGSSPSYLVAHAPHCLVQPAQLDGDGQGGGSPATWAACGKTQ